MNRGDKFEHKFISLPRHQLLSCLFEENPIALLLLNIGLPTRKGSMQGLVSQEHQGT